MTDGHQKRDKTQKPRKTPQARPDHKTRRDRDGAIIVDDDLADTLDAILKSETDDLFELCAIAGMDPLTDLAGASMQGVELCGKDLTGADFTHSNLSESKCIGTKLINAKLRQADLKNADFCGADLTGADLTGADITGANFAGAKVTVEQLATARGTPAARPPVHAERMCKLRRRNMTGKMPGGNGPS